MHLKQHTSICSLNPESSNPCGKVAHGLTLNRILMNSSNLEKKNTGRRSTRLPCHRYIIAVHFRVPQGSKPFDTFFTSSRELMKIVI